MARSAYDPPDPFDPEDVEEMVATAILEDDLSKPSEGQLEFMRHRGGQLIQTGDTDLESDPTGTLTRGKSPESIRGRVQVVSDVNQDGSMTTFDLSIDGKLDPDWVLVTEKYKADAFAPGLTDLGRRDLAARVFEEVAELKKSRATKKKTQSPSQPRNKIPEVEEATPAPIPVTHQSVAVRVNLGPGFGWFATAYRDVIISEKTLVLVSDPPTPGVMTWVPPEPDPDAIDPLSLELAVAGLEMTVRVFPLGLSYMYAGKVHYVLLIDRPTE